MSAPLLIREICPVVKVLDEAAGLVRYTASDESLDSYAEIVRASGWRFSRFSKNAPFVDCHDYSSITKLLGQVVGWQVKDGALIEDVKYSREPGTLGEWAFKLVRDGFLRAVSVGFVPTRVATKWDTDQAAFLGQITELKLDAATATKLRTVYLEQEQIELSQCVIGANPNALAQVAKAYRAGCLSEQDVDQFSALMAKTQTAAPAHIRADAEAATRRTRAAIQAEILALL